jgi:hypothetical protein
MTDDITKELAETLRELRTKLDSRESLIWTMVEVDAILDRYDDACKAPEPSMISCWLEGEPPNGCPTWNDWYEKFGSRGILHSLKISSLEHKTTPQPEPIINKVEVIANTKGTEMKFNLKEFLNKKVTVKFYNGSIITGVILRNPDEGLFRLQYKTLVSDIDDSYSGYQEKTILVFRKYMEDGVYVPTGKTNSVVPNHGCNIVDIQLTEEPEMTITKPPFYYNLTPGDKTMYTVAEEEVSKQWATALSGLVDNLGGDGPALWEWEGKTPTPEKVIACLQDLFDFHMHLAADNELDECCGILERNGYLVHSVNLRKYRRPQPTLKSQALKDFETVRKHSDLLPEILDTIEKALMSIPDEKGV